MTKILIQEGFQLNPSEKVVSSILKRIEMCNGKCPCYHGDEIPDEDLLCPCKEYRENKHCRCNFYVKSV